MILEMFDPVIYPYKIWIVINKTPECLSEYFYEYSGKPIQFEDSNGTNRMEAFCMQVKGKVTSQYGTVIYFRNKKNMDYDIIAHEASHAAKQLFEHINADMSDHEPFEYLVGWIAKCCGIVKHSKEFKADLNPDTATSNNKKMVYIKA